MAIEVTAGPCVSQRKAARKIFLQRYLILLKVAVHLHSQHRGMEQLVARWAQVICIISQVGTTTHEVVLSESKDKQTDEVWAA
jgi:hypothetical protein